MRAIKRINHNAAICEDASGRQLIALGRGIGFGDLPRDVALPDIQRTFYDIDAKYLAFIDDIEPGVLEFAAQLADVVVQQVSYELSPNLPITLADHLQFALKRAREHMVMTLPLSADVQLAHPIEFKLGEVAVGGMQKTFGVRMQRGEAAGIALSIVNAAVVPSSRRVASTKREDALFEQACTLVESEMQTTLNRESISFARFSTHVRYLLKRVADNTPLETENSELYAILAEQSPRAAACARKIGSTIEQAYEKDLTEEELLYLIMHINRITSC